MDEVAKLKARVQELEERLEITHAWRWDGEKEKLVRFELTEEEKHSYPDGIDCRDATISILEQNVEKLRAQIKRLKAEPVEGGSEETPAERLAAAVGAVIRE